MKSKLLIVLLTLSSSMAAVTVVFAGDADSSSKIKTADQLKQAMKADMDDGNLSAAEKNVLISSSTDIAVAELVEEKMEVAAALLDGMEMNADMKSLQDGSERAIHQYDLGDGCTLIVELQDQAEVDKDSMPGMLAVTANSNELWKDYGNRYFTATATVDCNVGSTTLSLENHYTLSSNGIDERSGKAGGYGDNSKIMVVKGNPAITDGTARTPGGSDVNMHCDYTVKALTASGTQSSKNTYRLNTTVKYLAIDKTGKRIKVGQAWNLTKVS